MSISRKLQCRRDSCKCIPHSQTSVLKFRYWSKWVLKDKKFALRLLERCYQVFAFQVWEVLQHLATLCFALWILITCQNWLRSGLNENLPMKYVVLVVILFSFFLTSFLKVRFGCLKQVSFFCCVDNAVLFPLFKALVGSTFAVGPLFSWGLKVCSDLSFGDLWISCFSKSAVE